MGCASSKRTEVRVDVYRPPPSSFAVFDINSIDEPWLLVDKDLEKDGAPAPDDRALDGKPSHVPDPILLKIRTLDSTETPQSWVEVSKALEDLKTAAAAAPPPPPPPAPRKPLPLPPSASNWAGEPAQRAVAPRKSVSFHTLEELDAKLTAKPVEQPLRKTESMRSEPRKKAEAPVAAESRVAGPPAEFKSVKNNIFILKDRLEREKEGKMANYERILLSKRDPLSEFPVKCPPRGEDSLVIYTTSLRGVRRTYEDCARARGILEIHRAVFDERDVALHGEFLSELREILGDEEGRMPVPRVFLKGRYLGGVEELGELNESGRFGKLLAFAGVERGPGRLACEGCGGGRFVPCLDCGGSCKVVVEGRKERCGKCNENGLVHCPVCL